MNDFIRQEVISKRKRLNEEEIKEKSEAIASKLLNLPQYRSCDNLLIYADAKGEVKTDDIINKALNSGKRVYLPLTAADYSMDFYRIDSLHDLECGEFGIMSPKEDHLKLLKASDIGSKSICVVPGVAFDKQGNRLGYGKGFYDRYLGRMKIPFLIGLSYEFQITESIDAGKYDIPMNMIITENNIYERLN